MTRSVLRLTLAGCCAAALGLALARPAAVPSQKPIHDPRLPRPAEAAAQERPEATRAGSWQGSWYYSDRWSRMAFWFEEKGKLKMRYRYELKGEGDAAAEAFGDSGETGTGSSSTGTGPGQLRIDWKAQRDGSIHGRIERVWPDPEGHGEIIESNDFDLWRIRGGDEIYLIFTNTKRERRSASGTELLDTEKDQGFTLRKLTDEIVHWEELIS